MSENNKSSQLPLGKTNYIVVATGVALLIVGFLLMSGGASENPVTEFNYEMFSTRRIVVAPIVLLLGFIAVGVGIMKQFNTKNN